MTQNTKIEWCNHTFNPWWGCTKVSDGCKNCYAEALDKRTAKGGAVHFGSKADRRMTGATNWKLPLRWDRAAHKAGTRTKVFCASMADIFDDHPSILWHWRDSLWDYVEMTGNLDWLLLTKRPQNIYDMVPRRWTWISDDWPKNAWIGTSVEDQTSSDARIPHLIVCHAPIRFLSVEPMLGPIVLPEEFLALGNKGWVICGGESGPQARPVHPDWLRSLRDQCTDAGVPFFFKQWGEFDLSFDRDRDDPDWKLCGQKELKPGRWINLAGGSGFHGERVHYALKVGKKTAGRMLDGREWNEMPGLEG